MTVNEAITELIKGNEEAVKMALRTLRKEIPKPIHIHAFDDKIVCTCPVCGWLTGKRDKRVNKECYCKHCGQKLIYKDDD